MELSSLDAGDFILGGLITFRLFHKPGYEWAVVTKTVHRLKSLKLSKSNDSSPTMAIAIMSYCNLSKAYDHVVTTLLAPDKKFPMNSSPTGVPAV